MQIYIFLPLFFASFLLFSLCIEEYMSVFHICICTTQIVPNGVYEKYSLAKFSSPPKKHFLNIFKEKMSLLI